MNSLCCSGDRVLGAVWRLQLPVAGRPQTVLEAVPHVRPCPQLRGGTHGRQGQWGGSSSVEREPSQTQPVQDTGQFQILTWNYTMEIFINFIVHVFFLRLNIFISLLEGCTVKLWWFSYYRVEKSIEIKQILKLRKFWIYISPHLFVFMHAVTLTTSVY